MTSCMAANYGRPKPVDPFWYRFGFWQELQDFAAQRQLPATIELYQVMKRLHCSGCGERPYSLKVGR